MEVTVGQNERENGETRIHRPFPYKPSRSTPIFTHRKMVRMIHRQITYLLAELTLFKFILLLMKFKTIISATTIMNSKE